MKAIVVNAGATVTVMNTIHGHCRCEPMFLRDPMRFDVAQWCYNDPGPIKNTILIWKDTAEGHRTEICVAYKDVGFAFT